MGIGQHYIKAEWAAKHFGEKDITNIHLSDKEKNDIRNYILKTIKLETIFNENTINIDFLESIIKNKPVANLYSSKSIISLEVENVINVSEIEGHTNKISYLYDINKNKDKIIKDLIPFISLHESRSIGVFHYYNNAIINIITSEQNNDIESIKKIVNYGYMLKDEKFNKDLISNLNIILSNKNKNEIFNLSKKLFNHLHPQIYNLKRDKYKNYIWTIIRVNDNTLSLSDCPIINFSECWHQYKNFNLFLNLQNDNQKIIQDSIFCFLAKDLILWGYSTNSNNSQLHKKIISSEKTLKFFLNDIYNFLIVYNLMCSFDFYSITSPTQKQDLFKYIVDNFDTLKQLYNLNLPNRNKFI